MKNKNIKIESVRWELTPIFNEIYIDYMTINLIDKIDDLLDRQSGLIIDDILKYKNKEVYIRELELIKNIRSLLKDFYDKKD